MANREKVDAVLDAITVENLNMEHWVEKAGTASPAEAPCGTQMCFAGHAVVQAGYQLDYKPLREFESPTSQKMVTVGWYADHTTTGERIPILAQELLDLTEEQADCIFYSVRIGNDVEVLKKHVNNVLDGELDWQYNPDHDEWGDEDEEEEDEDDVDVW